MHPESFLWRVLFLLRKITVSKLIVLVLLPGTVVFNG